MIIVRFVLPLVTALILGCAYSFVSKHKLVESFAPAFCIQILLMLVGGICFSSISLGIMAGIIIAFGAVLVQVISAYSSSCGTRFSKSSETSNKFSFVCVFQRMIAHDCDFVPTIVFFVVIYCFLFISNYGKHYNMWDEFSHWGIFVKETLRLDNLYCTSPASMAHKDYVPAITLFEVLWCRLSLRYSEADTYRGIQALQLAMMMPMVFSVFSEKQRETGEKITNNYQQYIGLRRLLNKGTVAKIVIVIGIPMLFSALDFYHTIYQDLIFGVLVYYCMYLIISARGDQRNDFEILLAVTILIMSKMVAMAFLPMILIFYFVWQVVFNKKRFNKVLLSTAILGAIPIGIWIGFNKYVSKYLPNLSGGQSYDSLGGYISKLRSILLHDGTITYQTNVNDIFIRALFSEKIIGVSSYVSIIAIVICGLLVFALFIKEKDIRNRILLIDMWIVLASIAYAILMWYLYLTSFSEYEAVRIASYHRYMSTFVLTALLLGIFTVFYYANEKVNNKLWVGAILLIENVAIFTGFSQILPGTISGDQVQYVGETEYITNNVPEGGSVFMITRSDNARLFNGEFTTMLNYYCAPRVMTNLSPGTPMSEYDIYSQDISQDELVSRLSGYDYIYFVQFDDYFVEKYSGAFENPDIIEIGKIYPIEEKNGKIAVRE